MIREDHVRFCEGRGCNSLGLLTPTFRWRVVSSISPAVVDWATRRSFASRVDHDGGGFCVEALEEAIAKYGNPKYSTRIRAAVHRRGLHGVLIRNGVAISMDGKGSWRDSVLERLWRSVKYEEVYLHAYGSGLRCARVITVIWRSTTSEDRIRGLERANAR